MNAPLPGEAKQAPSKEDLQADAESFMNLMQSQKKG